MNDIEVVKIYNDISSHRKDADNKYYNFYESSRYAGKFKIIGFGTRKLLNDSTTMGISIILSNRYKEWAMNVKVIIRHRDDGIYDEIDTSRFSEDFIDYEDVVKEIMDQASKRGWL